MPSFPLRHLLFFNGVKDTLLGVLRKPQHFLDELLFVHAHRPILARIVVLHTMPIFFPKVRSHAKIRRAKSHNPVAIPVSIKESQLPAFTRAAKGLLGLGPVFTELKAPGCHSKEILHHLVALALPRHPRARPAADIPAPTLG